MNPLVAIILILITTTNTFSQVDTSFFPSFTPYNQNPVISFGDELNGSPWNDPSLLKENNQYIMYNSGVEGGINHPNDTIAIYRWTSNDGYSWTLNPSFPVLKSDSDTYYEGAIETPTVVFLKSKYHMYNTVYRQNIPTLFKISHATSIDGINWKMDSTPVIEPTPNLSWMNQITAEPGVMVKNDTLYLFYSAVGNSGNQSIGLVRSIDGHNFIDTTLAATIPIDVYPSSGNYAGLSTPSPILIENIMYLFTDVAQFKSGLWTQVALHQFKSYGDLNKWYHDTVPIHTLSDFSWTNGNYLSEIRSITPLLDGDRLRIWYAGHNLAEIDTLTGDTINHVHFEGNELHVDSGYWAIGTSEYLFKTIDNIDEINTNNKEIEIKYYLNKGVVKTNNNLESTINIFSIDGQNLYSKVFSGSHSFNINHNGIIFIRVTTDKTALTKKVISLQIE